MNQTVTEIPDARLRCRVDHEGYTVFPQRPAHGTSWQEFACSNCGSTMKALICSREQTLADRLKNSRNAKTTRLLAILTSMVFVGYIIAWLTGHGFHWSLVIMLPVIIFFLVKGQQIRLAAKYDEGIRDLKLVQATPGAALELHDLHYNQAGYTQD